MVKDCWFLHPEKAKASWLARNQTDGTEQPINLLTIGSVSSNSLEISTSIPFDPLTLPSPEQPNPLPDTASPISLLSITMPEDKEPMPTDNIDPSIISFEGISELDLDLVDTFSQERMVNLDQNSEPRYEDSQEIPQSTVFPSMGDSSWISNKENEDAIALALDEQEIPEDWNFSFMTMQPNLLQALRSKIQVTVPENRVAYNYLSTVWHIDSGATSHICAHCSMFQDYTKIQQSSAVWTGAGPIKAVGTGAVRITLVCSNGATTVILLKGVLHVPGFLTNLVSVSRLCEKGVYWRSDNFTLRMTKTDAEIRICKLVGSLFVLQTNEVQDVAMVTKAAQNIRQKPTWELLHARLGHLNSKT